MNSWIFQLNIQLLLGSAAAAATAMRWDGRIYFSIFRSLSSHAKVKELLKTVYICQSYHKNTRNTLDCDQSNYSSRIVFSHIPFEFGQTGISAIQSVDPENPILEPNTEYPSKSDDPPQWYRHLNFPTWRPSRHIGFSETGNSAIRSADLENPTVEPNMKWIGRPLA